MCFEASKTASGPATLTEIGKQAVAMSQIPVAALQKKGIEAFQAEYADENIAELHFNHH